MLKLKRTGITTLLGGAVMIALIMCLLGYQLPMLVALVIGILAGAMVNIGIEMFAARYYEEMKRRRILP